MRGLCIAMCVCILPAHAAVSIDDRVERYDVKGSTPLELRREINAKGPQGAGGRRFDGYTRWDVSWNYRYQNAARSCAIASVTTTVKVTMTLPRWSNENGGSSAVRTQWARYLAALESHEQGHRRHGINAANEVDRAIAVMPSAGDCDALGANANATATRILRRYNQMDLDYDRETEHGATQGARFP